MPKIPNVAKYPRAKGKKTRRQESPPCSPNCSKHDAGWNQKCRDTEYHRAVDLPGSSPKPIPYHSWQPNNSASVSFSSGTLTVGRLRKAKERCFSITMQWFGGKWDRNSIVHFFSCKINSTSLEQFWITLPLLPLSSSTERICITQWCPVIQRQCATMCCNNFGQLI